MQCGYSYKRLTDKSAFVVFDNQSYKTYIIQNMFIFEFFKNKRILVNQQEFDSLSVKSQIELLVSSGIKDEFI